MTYTKTFETDVYIYCTCVAIYLPINFWHASNNVVSTLSQHTAQLFLQGTKSCPRWESNPRVNYTQDSSFFPRKEEELPWVGIEPTTLCSLGERSTNWGNCAGGSNQYGITFPTSSKIVASHSHLLKYTPQLVVWVLVERAEVVSYGATKQYWVLQWVLSQVGEIFGKMPESTVYVISTCCTVWVGRTRTYIWSSKKCAGCSTRKVRNTINTSSLTDAAHTNTFTWGMIEIWRRRSCRPISLVSRPSITIWPNGSASLKRADTMDDLPAPVRPTIPTWELYTYYGI